MSGANQYGENSYWPDADPDTGCLSQDLGTVALPGRDDRHSGSGRPGGAAGTTVAGMAVGDRSGQLARRPGTVHQPDLGGADGRRHGALAPARRTWPRSSVRSTLPAMRRSGKTAFSRTATAASTGGWQRFCRASGSFGSRQSFSPSRRLALAALAGIGWDRICAGRARRAIVAIGFLIVVSLCVLAGVVIERHPIVAAFGSYVRHVGVWAARCRQRIRGDCSQPGSWLARPGPGSGADHSGSRATAWSRCGRFDCDGARPGGRQFAVRDDRRTIDVRRPARAGADHRKSGSGPQPAGARPVPRASDAVVEPGESGMPRSRRIENARSSPGSVIRSGPNTASTSESNIRTRQASPSSMTTNGTSRACIARRSAR